MGILSALSRTVTVKHVQPLLELVLQGRQPARLGGSIVDSQHEIVNTNLADVGDYFSTGGNPRHHPVSEPTPVLSTPTLGETMGIAVHDLSIGV